MKFKDMKIGVKLALAFGLMLLLAVAVGAFALAQIARVNGATTEIAGEWMAGNRLLAQVQGTIDQFRRTETEHVLTFETKEVNALEQRMDGLKKDLGALQAKYEALIAAAPEADARRAAYDAFKTNVAKYLDANAKLVPIARGGMRFEEAKVLLMGDSRAAYDQVGQALGRLTDINSAGAEQAYRTSQQAYGLALAWVIGLLIGMVAVASLLAIGITRQVTRPLGQAVDAATRIAAGDLTVQLSAQGKDELAHLIEALGGMSQRLRELVAAVRTDADGVALASGEIAQGNADLSSRTESQAATLQQTAAAVEQMTGTQKSNAENARQANTLAGQASDVARKGGAVVEQVVETMKGINESSRRIAEIIGVIDGIAFQTNILALNAAVEAARAGEQGRGFAVVAAEVRTLAQRSAAAAREIKELITDSVGRVDTGSRLVDQAGSTMSEVVGSIERVTTLVAEITTATVEQSSGIEQINQAVTQMDTTTQQNAALVEQSAAAAATLKAQAERLVQAVGVFRVATA
jgi:methyl-accepting chemotaxis protein